ncbi:MAG TPA: sigma-70 family RNA polymerase sigma factor [Gemmataceae bacterium]|jgi:RNA polymerase sigma factor (sigma-70 family)
MATRQFDPILSHLRALAGPPDDCGDAELLERFLLSREEAAFAALVRRHGPLVLGVCRRMLRHEQDAEDAFQAAFLVLARKAGSIRNKESLAAWLYEVAYHIAARMRAETVRRNIHERQVAGMPRANADAEVTEREWVAVLDEELNRLPEKYRRPLVLCCLQAKTHAHAAQELGLPVGSISRLLGRARELLRERLSDRGFTVPAALLGTALTAETLTAAVPHSLIVVTAQAARLVVLGAADAVRSASARPLGLADKALQTMSLTRLKMMTVVLILGSVLGGAGLVAQQTWLGGPPERSSQEQPKASPETAAKAAPAAVRNDRFGDPLPSGAIARLGTVRFRHEGEAWSLVFSPNGKILAALTASRVILWDARTGKEIQRLPEMRGSIPIGRLIDFSPDGRTLAGPQDSNHVGLWNVATGKLLRALDVPSKNKGIELSGSGLHTIRFSPDGRFLAVAGSNNRCYVLDAVTGEALHHFKEERTDGPPVSPNSLMFSPDSKMLAMQVLVRWKPMAYEIQVRDVRTGKILRRWQVGSDFLCDLAFSPDGKMLAAGGTDWITIWDAATSEVRTRIEKKKMGQSTNLAFTPDGKTLLSGSERDGKVHVWDVATGKERQQLDPRIGLVRSMVLSPDGKTVAAGGVYNTIRLWDVASGRELFPDPPGHSSSVKAVAYSPDGKLLLSAGENRQAWLWDTATGKAVRQIRVANGRAVAFSPDGQRFALLSQDKNIHVGDVATGKELFRLPPGDVWGVNALAYSPDGKILISADYLPVKGKNDVVCNLNVWDASTGRFLRRSSLAGIRPDSMALRGDGRTLAIGGASDRKLIRLWDLERDEEILALGGHELPVISLAFSPDGRTLVSGSNDRTVRLWEVATGKEIAVLKGHKREVATVAFSPDGRLVASGGDGTRNPVYDEIRLWDAATGAEIQHFQGHNSGVTSLAFSPDGARLASGLNNSTVLLWDVPRSDRRTRQLTPRDLGSLWTDLAGEDARRAYAAIRKLTEDPEQTLAFLTDRLHPAPRTESERIRRWIVDLSSDEYAVRQTARKELAALGEQARPLLRECLTVKPSLEVRKRVEELLSQTKVLHAGDVVRGVRAAATLEQIATPAARRLLEQLAQGAPEARLTREAKSSLERLAKQR